MRPPAVTLGVNFINFALQELGLRVLAERFTNEGIAELSFFLADRNDSLLPTRRVNLLSSSAMSSLVKELERHAKDIKDIPWTEVLAFVTNKTLEIARQGEAPVEIWSGEDSDLIPQYLLEPILPLHHPTVIFGDYGSCKSLMGLVIAYVVQLPWQDNPLGFTTAKEPSQCLFLDYEDDRDNFKRRWNALERGLGKGAMLIVYRRMVSPLCDDVEQIQRIIQDKSIELVIVDSLGPAARGNLNDPEAAIKYLAALRQLNTTSLTLAHTAKDQLTKRRTIFGSVFFTNLARSVWEVKSEQEAGEDEAVISLKHTKANLSRLHPALGYRFTFTDKSISVAKIDLKDTGLSGELPLPWQIKNLLKEGTLTMKEIVEMLDRGEDTIKSTLSRMAKKQQVVKLPEHKWGLRQYES
jgi:hypothetical protein